MTLDEAIKIAEEEAKEQDKLCKRYDDASGYTRSHNEDIRTTDAKRCEKCAEEHRQFAEWLKDYKRLLEQEPCTDAISRDDALMALTGEWTDSTDELIHQFIRRIKNLPPVTPQPKYEYIAKAFQFGMALGFGEKHDEMDRVIEEIKKAVTPQPKTGHWIDVDGIFFKCSECDAYRKMMPAYKEYYCPNCGAKMQEVEE